MTDFPLLRDLGYILLAATGFVLIARKLNTPTIVASELGQEVQLRLTGVDVAKGEVHFSQVPQQGRNS